MMENKEHEFCLRCGRRLKNPVARIKGYGVVCEKKIKFYGQGLFDGNQTNLQSSPKEKDLL